jgi:putative transcriptional regulator
MEEIQSAMDAVVAQFADMDVEAVAKAIEDDAGQDIPHLRRALHEAKAGKFARVTTPGQILARTARAKTGLTQQDFARLIATPVATLRDWEQGRFEPPGGMVCLFRLIEHHPELTTELAEA